MRIKRIAATGCAVGALTAALSMAGAVATAETQPPSSEPGSVTITLSPEQVRFLCEQRLPRTESRTTKLIERINGGADVRGSAEWLRKRAERERAAGRETTAEVLEERAERRAGRVDELNRIKTQVAEFRSQYCGGSK